MIKSRYDFFEKWTRFKQSPLRRNHVPEDFRSLWTTEILRENNSRLALLTPILLLVEIILYFYEDLFFSTGPAILGYIIGSLVLCPLILVINIRNLTGHHLFARIIQTLYLSLALGYGVAIGVLSQPEGDASYIYLVFALCVAVLFYLTPLESTVLLALSYLAFFFLLPFYQADDRVVAVLRVNSVVVILIAMLTSQMVNRMKLRSFLDQKTIEAKNEALERLVMLDQMTQLLNHATAFFKLQNEVNRADRIVYPLSLIMFDIDDFKWVNDTYGHPFGDTVIREVAVATALSLRRTDLCGRYGGEEFIIILPDTDLAEATNVANRVLAAITAIEFEHPVHITVSGGISQYEGGTTEDLVSATDAKLYKAKRNGKNRFESELN